MVKHYSNKTKKTYSKYSKPEPKDKFRQRLKKPCPKFEDLFIDKDVGENLFETPPPISKKLFDATTRSPNLKNSSSIYSPISSGNDTFDNLAKLESNNVQSIKPKSIIKSPGIFSTNATPRASSSSMDDMFLSALQSPCNRDPRCASSEFGSGKKCSINVTDLPEKEPSNVFISNIEESFDQNKNLTSSLFNVITSTPALEQNYRCPKRLNMLKNELSPVDKNVSFKFFEDSFVGEYNDKLLNTPTASQITTNVSANLSLINTVKNLDLNSESRNTEVDKSSDIVYSDEDVFLSNAFSNILCLKPTTFYRVTRRRKFIGTNKNVDKEKFYYHSNISLPNHSHLDKTVSRNLSNSSHVSTKVSSSNLEKDSISNVSALSVTICKGGKGWRRSVKKMSTVIPNLSLKSDISGFLEKEDIKDKTILLEDFRTNILNICDQNEELLITECFNKSMMEKCKKVGEGLYGEVFVLNVDEKSEKEVLKLMPIEGTINVNGESQKSFEQMVPEIIISKYLSDLHQEHLNNFCPTFVKLNKCWCLKGSYTAEMLELWDFYANNKGSENDRPDFFPQDQIHLALQFEFAGQDLEAYIFNNGTQAHAIFLQVAYALCVGELELEFEHRDLHWGNLLISQTSETFLEFKIKGRLLKIKTYGVKAKIIDFTLSRLTIGERTFFNDLSKDPDLFTASGDYQFDVYRLMRANNKDDWKAFQPKSNIYWLHYLILKIKNDCYYKNKNSKVHKQGLKEMDTIENSIIEFDSASDFVCWLENVN